MENKDDIAYKLICMSCLCFGMELHPVTEEKLIKYYLDVLNEIPLFTTSIPYPKLCGYCKALLKKAVTFKQQAQDSFRVLQSYTNETLNECLLTEVTRQTSLRVHTIEPISIPPSENDADSSTDVQTVCVKDEVKIEWNGNEAEDTTHSDYPPSDSEDTRDIDDALAKLLHTVKGNKKKRKDDIKERKTRRIVKRLRGNSNKNRNVSVLTEEVKQSDLGNTRNSITDVVSLELDGDKHTIMQINCPNENDNNEWNDKEVADTARSDCPPSDSDEIKDIDADLGTMLRNVKEKKKKRKEDRKEKKTRRIVKSVRGNSKDEQSKLTGNQKILTIELSYEEMLSERESESKRESYLRSEYKCESCLVGFNYSKCYKRHVATKHSADLGEYSCPICKTVMASVESFTAHYKRHMRRYECSICHKRTQDMKVMQQHYFSSHEISLKRYKCHLCGKLSNSIDTHRYHKDTHKARVQCSECDKTFTHRAGLLNHRLAVHEYNNSFTCTVCEKVFRWKTSLRRHLKRHALENKNMTAAAFCTTCDVSFSSVCSYQRHMKNSLKHVSHEQLRFICDHCNKRFADKTKLRDHIEEKHLHKTYQCHICLKPSKNRMGLDQHIRNVHRGRPNNKMCHHCGKGFPTKVQLESHIRTHTGERPFICEYCPTTFSQQSNLYKHNRQVHLNIKSKRYPICKKKDVTPEHPAATQSDSFKSVAVLHYTLPDRGFLV
ncbi:uncharacterized protein ACR2FA_010043 [Aphomia sociella]